MSNERGSKVSANKKITFGEVRLPTDPNSLTASYQSGDWREDSPLTFSDPATEQAPFLPNLSVEPGDETH